MTFTVLLIGAVLLSGDPGGSVLEDSEGILAALNDVQEADAIYGNALLLYLRLAGVVWIAVEWVAAVILWRAYRLLRHSVERKGAERC